MFSFGLKGFGRLTAFFSPDGLADGITEKRAIISNQIDGEWIKRGLLKISDICLRPTSKLSSHHRSVKKKSDRIPPPECCGLGRWGCLV
jgi:hypothetical protein